MPRRNRPSPRGPKGILLPPFSPRMVLLHVYDLTPAISAYINRIMRPFGAGAFHAGVEVFGQEYCFGQTPDDTTGVNVCEPMQHPAHIYRETVPMGPTDLNVDDFCSLMNTLKKEWPGNSYDILTRHGPSLELQNQANSIKGGARAAAAAAAAAARQLQRLDTHAGISATATAAAEAAAHAASAAAGAAVSFGRLLKQAHQDVRLSDEMGRYILAGVNFLGERLAEGVSCLPSEWHEDDCHYSEAFSSCQRCPQLSADSLGILEEKALPGPPSDQKEKDKEQGVHLSSTALETPTDSNDAFSR
ncbi:hypothetical protein cyc_06796 [Cyclospora cayetanensis]|uniref:PPPDE domain-containing protein n=1 Tax=Cyclospora cayetanensis TaxID=88456 RepID=A0A1D3CU83_9EIME|nr:hypothetical protein cyc_06796 [Cyclospora cayetanensis]